MNTQDLPAILPRNLHFEFDESLPPNWHSGNPVITSYFDALSLTFPEGERFFIDSVKNFATEITDPGLKRDVRAFTAQEAVHSREHAAYNALLAKRGFPVGKCQDIISRSIKIMKRVTSHRQQLAATCAYEHFTALFAEGMLGDPRVFAGAHPFYSDLWHWHAMEEEEHKAVAFDVFRTVAPGAPGYFVRCLAMVLVTLDFAITTTLLSIWILARRGELWNLKAWAASFRYHWIAPGRWPRVLLGVLAYFAPGFHPAKRHVSPEVLAWRNYYRQTSTRLSAMPGSIFETLPRGA